MYNLQTGNGYLLTMNALLSKRSIDISFTFFHPKYLIYFGNQEDIKNNVWKVLLNLLKYRLLKKIP